jgi:hypothetical protein
MLLTAGNGWSAEPVTPIGSLLVNPSAAHRKMLKLEGVAKNVATYSGREMGTNQSLCGANFQLEDDSGTINVLFHVRCQAGEQRAATVVEGAPIVVEGYMEAPPTMMRTPDGKDLGFRIIAHTVTSVK